MGGRIAPPLECAAVGRLARDFFSRHHFSAAAAAAALPSFLPSLRPHPGPGRHLPTRPRASARCSGCPTAQRVRLGVKELAAKQAGGQKAVAVGVDFVDVKATMAGWSRFGQSKAGQFHGQVPVHGTVGRRKRAHRQSVKSIHPSIHPFFSRRLVSGGRFARDSNYWTGGVLGCRAKRCHTHPPFPAPELGGWKQNQERALRRS